MSRFFLALLLTLLCATSGYGTTNPYILPDSVKTQVKVRAKMHADRLLALPRKANYLWRRAGWWNSANIFEALLDYHRLTGSDFTREIKKIYRRNEFNFVSYKFRTLRDFDDDEWWALSWFKAYQMTGDKRYLSVTKGIFDELVRLSWTRKCDGGLIWKPRQPYKNAVTNELFIIIAARLAIEEKDSVKKQYYQGWALREWTWFRKSKMYTDSAWISDGLTHDCSCVVSDGLDLTYNQGIVLGALTYLYQLTSDRSYLAEAQKLAHSSMKKYISANGVLTEYGDINHDKIQFKGIYIRYLALLNTELHDADITGFILHNADHVWQHCRSADGLCDFDWNGPYKDWSGSAQGSTMDLMNAALMQ